MKKLIFSLLLAVNSLTATAEMTELIIPYSPGGVTDAVARQIIKPSSDIIAINKPGGNGSIAMMHISSNKKSFVLGIDINLFGTNLLTFKDKLPYNPADYEVVATIGTSPSLLVCRSGLNFKSVADIASYQKPLSFAAPVRGGIDHIRTIMLMQKLNRTNDQIVHYASSGAGKATLDLLGGHIDCYFSLISSIPTVLDNPKLSKLLVTTNSNLVDKSVETWADRFKEPMMIKGIHCLIVANNQYSLDQKTRLIKDLEKVVNTEIYKTFLLSIGMEPDISFGTSAQRKINQNVKYSLDTIQNLKIKFSDD